MASFGAQVADAVANFEDRSQFVFRRSVELLADEMRTSRPQGGRVPFLTGNLIRSLLASKAGMPPVAPGPFAGDDVGAVTATLQIGETVWLGYQANYARRQNYGFVGTDSLGRSYNQQGAHFVEGAAENWQAIVRQAISELPA